jgi:hypothetical protein
LDSTATPSSQSGASIEPVDPIPDPEVENPVLTADDVTDVDAMFVADPFLYVDDDGVWHMFFETLDKTKQYGVISHALSFDTGRSWEYNQVVIDPGAHTSFPYVFEHDGEVYITLRRRDDGESVRLYRAETFPREWERLPDLFSAKAFGNTVVDNCLLQWDDRWYDISYGYSEHCTNVYYADTLHGEWKEHARNPVAQGKKHTRPAGRPVVRDDSILMFYQECDDFYGEAVRAFEIEELSPESFRQTEVEESPILDGTADDPLNSDETWNSLQMHHYDPRQLDDGTWRCAVDGGARDSPSWSIGIYRQTE